MLYSGLALAKDTGFSDIYSAIKTLNSRPRIPYFDPSMPTKGQLISKANYQALNSSKKRTNDFVFTAMQRVFIRFLEEIEDTKKGISKLTDL